ATEWRRRSPAARLSLASTRRSRSPSRWASSCGLALRRLRLRAKTAQQRLALRSGQAGLEVLERDGDDVAVAQLWAVVPDALQPEAMHELQVRLAQVGVVHAQMKDVTRSIGAIHHA